MKMTNRTLANDALATLQNYKNAHEAELLQLKSLANLNEAMLLSDETPKVVLAVESTMAEVMRLRIESTQKIVSHLELAIEGLYDIIDEEREPENGER